MKSTKKQLVRACLVLAAGVVAAGIIAPFVNASAFKGRIQHAVESTLGREVDFSEVHFTLFSGPGFTLDNVTIHEDPRFGLEPFAFVPELKVRLRLDRLLLGHIAVASLQLEDPSLNFVKLESGGWNVVELVQRVSGPSRLPVNLFPAFGISGGRIDFKLGSRKTVLYMTDSDISVYPERSGKLYVRFSGSPARTDRAGNGFGHIRGSANWYLQPASASANQLEADITLDESNLSELATLFAGHDAGVHGKVSSHATIEGPLNALRIRGDVRLGDLQRWDLVETSGQDWDVPYSGAMNAVAHTLQVKTPASGEIALQVQSDNYLKQSDWQLNASLTKAALPDLLPLAARMGVHLADKTKLNGTVDGSVSYAGASGLTGNLVATNLVATEGDNAPLRAQTAAIQIADGHVTVQPTALQTDGDAALTVAGDYDTTQQAVTVTADISKFPIETIRSNVEAWLGDLPALDRFGKGVATGHLTFTNPGAVWSGDLRFSNVDIEADGLALPLVDAQGHAAFHGDALEVDHFSARLRDLAVSGNYQYNAIQRHPERLSITMPSADANDIEWALRPAAGDDSLLARIGVGKHAIPDWMAHRDLQGDVTVTNFSVGGNALGALKLKLLWQGSNIQLTSLHLALPEGDVSASGTVALSAAAPRYRVSAKLTDYPWHDGEMSAEADIQTSGLGAAVLSNLHGEGKFTGTDVNVATGETFSNLNGNFTLSFADGWPNVHLTGLEASQNEEAWTGEASTDRDGKLVFDLEHAGHQRHVISTLQSQPPSATAGTTVSLLQ